MSNDNWQDMSHAWQTRPIPDSVKSLSLEEVSKLKSRVRWLTIRMYVLFSIEVLITVVAVSFALYTLFAVPGLTEKIFYVVFIIIALWALYLAYDARKGTWRPMDDSIKAQVELLIKRAHGARKLVRATYFLSAVVFVFLFTLFMFEHVIELGQIRTRPLLNYGFGAVYLLVVLVVCLIYDRRKKQQLIRLKQLHESL